MQLDLHFGHILISVCILSETNLRRNQEVGIQHDFRQELDNWPCRPISFFALRASCRFFSFSNPYKPGAPTSSRWRPATARLERGQDGAPETVTLDFLPTSECSSFQQL